MQVTITHPDDGQDLAEMLARQVSRAVLRGVPHRQAIRQVARRNQISPTGVRNAINIAYGADTIR